MGHWHVSISYLWVYVYESHLSFSLDILSAVNEVLTHFSLLNKFGKDFLKIQASFPQKVHHGQEVLSTFVWHLKK